MEGAKWCSYWWECSGGRRPRPRRRGRSGSGFRDYPDLVDRGGSSLRHHLLSHTAAQRPGQAAI